MMGERPPDPRHMGETLNAGSSTGWTDEKHMLYISSLEESFVTQLCNGEVKLKGMFCRSSSVRRHRTSHKEKRTNTVVDQGYWEMLEDDGAESRLSQAEYIGSPSCFGDQEDRKGYNMDDDASTTEPRQERIRYSAKPKNPGVSSASHFHWHGYSSSRRTESSDQNFSDEQTKVSREQSGACSEETAETYYWYKH